MKALVAIKHTINAYVKPTVKNDGSGVDLSTVKMSMNPFDEIAVEEAVRLKEAGKIDEIIVVSIGKANVTESLRKALGMGADRGIHVLTDDDMHPLAVARVLRVLVEKEGTDVVLMGKQAIDGDNNQASQMLSGMMGWSQAMFASKVDITDGKAEVTREVDGGLETLSVNLPTVISTDLRLNEPRNVTLPNLMKAKQKPIEEMPLADLNIDTKSKISVLTVEEPKPREGGVKVTSVAELVQKLKDEARVI
ncbi:MAG: electron transfer flavoprotein subunit beta/FixA family protein [Pseudomonadota bacterium]|nr:electron transfer flavoprotein subunit beta/FixA family protein [Pseudomonadota bacterium]